MAKEEAQTELQKRILMNALLFTLGFSLVFIFFGLVSGAVGIFFTGHRAVIASIGGVIIVGFGIAMLGDIPFPRFITRVGLPRFLHPGRPFSAFMLGLLFALGWSPCLGPVLGTILLLAASSGTALYGAYLLTIYSLGLAIPFLFVALLYGSAFTYITPLAKYLPMIAKAAGALLIVIGVLLLMGNFGLLSTLIAPFSEPRWYHSLMNVCATHC